MKYEVVRTETADAQIRKIVLYIAENFGNKVALEKLEELEQNILDLAVHPLKGRNALSGIEKTRVSGVDIGKKSGFL